MATAASLYLPWSVAVDENGNLFIADQNNNRVRKIFNNGIITTYAGRGGAGYSGDGGCAAAAEMWYPWGVAAANNGDIYITDWGLNCIRKVSFAPCKTEQIADKKVYSFFPYPNQDLIEIIQNEAKDISADVKVMNAIGKIVYKGILDFKNGKAQLSTLNIPSGVYAVEIKDNMGSIETFRVIIEN